MHSGFITFRCRKISTDGQPGCFVLGRIANWKLLCFDLIGWLAWKQVVTLYEVDDTIDCSEYRYHEAVNCPGIEWRYCSASGDEHFDTGCDEEAADIEITEKQTTISLDGDLLKDFNQLSDIDLEASLGKIKTSNSLNEYMSKIDLCYFENDELIQVYSNVISNTPYANSAASEMLLRPVYNNPNHQ